MCIYADVITTESLHTDIDSRPDPCLVHFKENASHESFSTLSFKNIRITLKLLRRSILERMSCRMFWVAIRRLNIEFERNRCGGVPITFLKQRSIVFECYDYAIVRTIQLFLILSKLWGDVLKKIIFLHVPTSLGHFIPTIPLMEFLSQKHEVYCIATQSKSGVWRILKLRRLSIVFFLSLRA